MVGIREVMRLVLQKSAVVSEAVDVGNEDDSEKTKRRAGTSSHLWCSKVATTTRETQQMLERDSRKDELFVCAFCCVHVRGKKDVCSVQRKHH